MTCNQMCHSMLHTHTHCAIFIPPCFRQWLKLSWCNPALWKGFCCSTPQLSAPSRVNLSLIAGRCCHRRSGRQSCALGAAATAFSGFCFERCLLWIGMSCLGCSSRSLWVRRKTVQARRYRGMFRPGDIGGCSQPDLVLCPQYHQLAKQLCYCWESEPHIFPFLFFLHFALQDTRKCWLKFYMVKKK